MDNASLPPEAGKKLKARALLTCAAGAVLAAIGFFADRQAFALSYLTAYLFWLGVTLGCLPLLMLHHLTGGGWGYPIRRTMEMIVKSIPLLALAFLPVLFNLSVLYEWAKPEVVAHDAILQHKSLYLNAPFFTGRAVFYFIVWTFFAFMLNRQSKLFEETHEKKFYNRLQGLGGAGLVFYGLTVTFSVTDWAMSLEPHWFSTIYGFLFMMSQTLAGFSLCLILCGAFSARGWLKGMLNPTRTHDLGKLLFAFIMLWAYVNLSQFIIIWNGNLAEETPWYIKRFNNGWQILSLMLVFLQFVLPFFLLLGRELKRNIKAVSAIAGLVLFMRWVELVWFIKPAFHGNFQLHWLDLACFAALGGFWFFVLALRLAREPLVLETDPLLHGEDHGHA